jgi:sigma-70-like protein
MDEVFEYCTRILGPGTPAAKASHEAFATAGSDRLERLAAAVQACRARARAETVAGTAVIDAAPARADQPGSATLSEAVAREIAAATSGLPEREREVLALRELTGLTHDQIARVMEIGAGTAGPLLATARLHFRARLRDVEAESDRGCLERDRALEILVRRQDGEPVTEADEDWVLSHLRSCEACRGLHASMLEASVCYRAWRAVERTPDRAAQ